MAAGAAVASAVSPHWRAPGLPWTLGDGKNVETTAVLLGLLAGAVSRALVEIRGVRWLLMVPALAGIGLLVVRADLAGLASAWVQLLATGTVGALLAWWWTPAPSPTRADPVPPWMVPPVLTGLVLLAFVLAVRPLTIDVMHHGEVLASALDLLRGGRPFTTWLWPHGAHDTGLAALWLAITGKIGTSPVALAGATCGALGVVSLWILARRILGSRTEALAVVGVVVLAPVLLVGSAVDASWRVVLHQIGILVFVVAAFGVATSTWRGRDVAAGACLGAAYVFRIETSVYGMLAVVALIAVREAVAADWGAGALLRSLVAAALRLVVGFALVTGASRLAFGFPDAVWFRYTFDTLPRYHRDAVGLPFPWPMPGAHLSPGIESVRSIALGWLLLVLMLLVQAVRVLVTGGERPAARSVALVFAAAFALLATRTVLDRTDASHVLQWGAISALVAVLLVLALLRDRRGWGPGRAAVVAVVVFLLLDVPALRPALPHVASPVAAMRLLAVQGRVAAEHLRPNPAVGACADTSFTVTEAAMSTNREFIDATCTVEQLLRANGVTSLVLAHAAPWYQVRFGLPPKTRYFAFARAYNPTLQRELLDELRRGRPQAMLRAQTNGALAFFDIPDQLRVPVVDAWLRARRGGVPSLPTPLGDLWLWDEPAPCRPTVVPDANDAGGLVIYAEPLTWVPSQELLYTSGWAADVWHHGPLRALTIDDPSAIEYGLHRPDVAARLGVAALAPTGFELVAHVDAAGWAALQERGTLDLHAVGADGRQGRLTLPIAEARVLPAIDDPPWDDVQHLVQEAAALGRADRAAAGAGTSPCPR